MDHTQDFKTLNEKIGAVSKKVDILAEALIAGTELTNEKEQELLDLQHHRDTTVGLWAFDRDPDDLVSKYIENGNANLEDHDTVVLDDFVTFLKKVYFFQIKDAKPPEEIKDTADSNFLRKTPPADIPGDPTEQSETPGLTPGMEEETKTDNPDSDPAADQAGLSAEASAQAGGGNEPDKSA
jgi:hypothetical protein